MVALRAQGKIHTAGSEINQEFKPQMASVEEVQAGIARANAQANDSMGALQQASSALEQAQDTLTMATQGSSQPEAEQAKAQLLEAVKKIDEATQSVRAAISTAESYAARL